MQFNSLEFTYQFPWNRIQNRSPVDGKATKSSKSTFISSMNLTRDDLFERNHFYRAWMGLSAAVDKEDLRQQRHLPPMEVMTRYISEHSHQRLQLEWNEACRSLSSSKTPCFLDSSKSQRRYLVATYSCPLESGNRLHRYMNGLLWAILTNRTFLWRYQDYGVCEEYGEDNCAEEYQNMTRSPSDCNGLLIRSPWIPSYEEWKDKLGMSSDHSDLIKAEVLDRARKDTNNSYDNTTLPYDGMNSAGINNDEIRVIRTGNQVTLDPGKVLQSSEKELRNHQHLSKPENLARLRSLRSHGVYFLYGMFFESLFTMDPTLDPPKELLNKTAHQTIFLHSRHIGLFPVTYTWPDELCLKWFEAKLGDNSTKKEAVPCHIYLISDRPKAVSLLTERIENITHCTSSFVNQELPSEAELVPQNNKPKKTKGGAPDVNEDFISPSFRKEHGPRAGKGFWDDVALATHARDGMIAFHMFDRPLVRTSTALVREIVGFKRTLEYHYQDMYGEPSVGNTSGELPEFKECTSPLSKDKKKKKNKKNKKMK